MCTFADLTDTWLKDLSQFGDKVACTLEILSFLSFYLFNFSFLLRAPNRKLILLVLLQILHCLRTLTNCVMKGLVPSNECHDPNNKIQQTTRSDAGNADSVVEHTRSLTGLNNYWSLEEMQFAQPTTMAPAETLHYFEK